MDTFTLVMVVIVVVALLFLGRSLWVLRYRPATSDERTVLARSVLVHHTSTDAAAGIDQGDGTVHLVARAGRQSGVVELCHGNKAGYGNLDERAVYLYASAPTAGVAQFHGHSNDVEIRIDGARLDPARLHTSPHDSAVAVRGGYRGPGTIVPITNAPAPPERTFLQSVAAFFRVLVRIR